MPMPLDLSARPRTDPTAIYRYRDGIYATDLLVAAIASLDFFGWLAEHPSPADAICRDLALAERPADVMLTLFTAMQLVRNDRGVFHVTDLAREHLVPGSPWFLGPYFASLKDRPACRDMLNVLRTGTPANWSSPDRQADWATAMEDDAFATQFTAAMDSRAMFLGPAMARQLNCDGYRHLLDVAGASGIYACVMVAMHPHLQATVLDKPPVDQIARKLIAARGFADRVRVVAGDMFTAPFPPDCDVHLFSNVLHDWDVPKVRQLLQQSFTALPLGGMIVIHDAHLDAAKSGPLPVAEYSVLLMHLTEGKCYSVREMEVLLHETGFSNFTDADTAVDRSVLTARKPGRAC